MDAPVELIVPWMMQDAKQLPKLTSEQPYQSLDTGQPQ